MKLRIVCTLVALSLAGFGPAWAQEGSRNIKVVGQLPTEGGATALVVDQDPERPYAYLSRRAAPGGFIAVDLSLPDAPTIALVRETDAPAARDIATFKLQGRHYLAQAYQGETDAAIPAAIIFDVTALPYAPEAARITMTRGLRALFAYKHSDGRALLLATGGDALRIYDLASLLNGRRGHIATLQTPEDVQDDKGFDDVFAGFDPATQQDRLYLAGAGGYFVYDITDPSDAEQLTRINSAAVQRGRVIAPTPDGRYALTAASYRTAPIRIFDLSQPRTRTAVGAWTANWRNEYTDIQVRWPLAFAAALEDGLQVLNIFDPLNPYTDAYFRTGIKMPEASAPLAQEERGAYRVDIRNHDGLIFVSDLDTGLWAFKLDTFDGWHGHAWGLPHMSNAQDWDNGPDGR